MADAPIERFRFHADQSSLRDLEGRLRRAIWPDEVVAEPWRCGPPVAYMKAFIQHWLDRYDWRAHEERLNSFPPEDIRKFFRPLRADAAP